MENAFFSNRTSAYFAILRYCMKTIVKGHTFMGPLPSTERRKWRPLATNSKCGGDRQTYPCQKTLAPPGGWVSKKTTFCSHSIGPIGLYNTPKTECQNSPPFSRYSKKPVLQFCPFLRYKSKNYFKKGYTAMRQSFLYRSAQVVPLQPRKNLQRTFKNTPIKTFSALWRKKIQKKFSAIP